MAPPGCISGPTGTLPAMPELPDITVYCERLEALAGGAVLQRVRIQNPFVLRTAVPPIGSAEGGRLQAVQRLGKRVVLRLDDTLALVIHLMIAGRLHWHPAGGKPPPRTALAALQFDSGTLVLTEAGTQRRASIHLVQGEEALAALDPGGLELHEIDLARFAAALRADNRTLKRALTDPARFSGIGNAYSDEILHRARLSPVALTSKLDDGAVARLFDACRSVMSEWTERLRLEASSGWPAKVTAFRPGMAVHGRFGLPCPACGMKVARIVHASNETHYCPGCQTGGRLLADRALSRLLKASWPKLADDA